MNQTQVRQGTRWWLHITNESTDTPPQRRGPYTTRSLADGYAHIWRHNFPHLTVTVEEVPPEPIAIGVTTSPTRTEGVDWNALARLLVQKLGDMGASEPTLADYAVALHDVVADDDSGLLSEARSHHDVRGHKVFAEHRVRFYKGAAARAEKEMRARKAQIRDEYIDQAEELIPRAIKGKYRQEGAEQALRLLRRVGERGDLYV